MPSTCRPLPRAFFRPSPDLVAPALLGKLLVCRLGPQERRVRLVETEAYLGSGDRAAHSAAGRTPRNAVLFGPPGHAYVYFIYGMHFCLNVSTLPDGVAGGVLFRAAEEDGLPPRALAGPGRLTRALGIDLSLNGWDLTTPGRLFLADDGFRPARVARGPRIGIRHDIHLPLRFFLPGHRAVTPAPALA
ncbi:MAG: DNA-3-methyladenine glycosylase [Terriglobales bacterium]